MEARKLTSEEVCEELQIEYSLLMTLRREVDEGLLEEGRHPGDRPYIRRLLWGPVAVERLRSLLAERRRQTAAWNEMLTSKEVCRVLEISRTDLPRVRAFLGDRVRPEGRRNQHRWNREALEVLRAGLRQMAASRRAVSKRSAVALSEDGKLSSLQVCQELGVTYQRMMHLRRRVGNELPKARGQRGQLRWDREELVALRLLNEEGREQEEAAEVERHGKIVAAIRMCTRDAQEVFRKIERLLGDLEDRRVSWRVTVHTLPGGLYALAMPLSVSVFTSGRVYVASLPEAGLEAEGKTRAKAVQSLRRAILQAYERVLRAPGDEPELASILEDLIVAKKAR
jgi:hypothetical protein